MTVVIVLLFAASAPIAGMRWLRIAQREHYLPGETTRFAFRWWRTGPRNEILILTAIGAAVAALFAAWLVVVTIEIVAFGPLGLSMRGRTSPLAWTRRLKTLAAASVALLAAVVAIGVATDTVIVAVTLCAIAMPLFVDAALFALAPIERRAARKFVYSAQDRLARVSPTTIAITGSFGKTTIKGYIRHLTEGTRSVVASPASFNNTGGLSRTVNEMLAQDTEVFIAEMGTYGPGEIRDLCSWVKPDIAVLCNIGPVHLERFGTIENVVSSKAEIFEGAATAIINIDAYGLSDVADGLKQSGKRVLTCSEHDDTSADIVVMAKSGDQLCLIWDNDSYDVTIPDGVPPINAACAVGAAVALAIPIDRIINRLETLPGASHRCEISVSSTGVTVIDDTYNSNPAGAAAALASLGNTAAGRRVVVTPGMVELGSQQAAANTTFAADASALADDVIIVGFTNRAALDEGAATGEATVHHVRFRTQAVEWVRANLDPGDAVLYENDLPDHYA